MNFIKRGFIYITRNWMRSLILFLVLSILTTLALTASAIQTSAKHTATNVRQSVNGNILLDIDMSEENMKSEQSEWGVAKYYDGDQITDKTISAIKNVEGVVGYNMTATSALFVAGKNFKYLPAGFEMDSTPYGDTSSMTTTLCSDKFSGFTSGKLKLEKGRHLNENDKHAILISDELAELNNLDVGDTMELYVDYAGAYPPMDIDVKIIGIFSGTKGTDEDAITPSMRSGNQGIVDIETAREANLGELSGALEISVEDPSSIQNVYDRIAKLPEIEGKSFTLQIQNDDYNNIKSPLESLQESINIFIIVIAIVSVVLISLLLTIWSRSRVHELGILMSIGISKTKIMSQLLLESLLIALLAFAISYPLSNTVVDKATNFALNKAVDASKNDNSKEQDMLNGDFGEMLDGLTSNNYTEEIPEDFVATVDIEETTQVALVGVVLIIGSVFISSYLILKSKPKEILSKMS